MDGMVELFQQNSNHYRIRNVGFPASFAVFTSYMSGTPPYNYFGAYIREDNLMHQLVTHTGQPFKYVGTKLPAYDSLCNGDYFKNGVVLERTTETSALYQTLFQCSLGNSHQCAKQYLDREAAGRDSSIFFSGDMVDERNHMTGNKYHPATVQLLNGWIKDMAAVKQWVDQHPEYLLMIFSDHGGKTPNDTGAHGRNDQGNEAFTIIYNPHLVPLPADQQNKLIDQVDLCSTVTQYFMGSGASIPAENTGRLDPATTDMEHKRHLLSINLIQLIRLAKHLGILDEQQSNSMMEYEDSDTVKAVASLN
ncbi:hypothetical protein SAMD00019534_069040 [Acytostelium subglobosum LB1]|uniref:hypothetical protein n=1 Tax=Acytostelium subglobosum LB1 TaxID=1410327 RepID=UPI000644BC5B|nr:hypothetical protein SAMD00019534_069040 [Acytostelium subglobosum LB1]GAM23729.1 hypothetical protein SAMD00019534_069040 [Acytostelium subglobosum LB1]|eukprot:XP_012753470.1 hypothetical protein SAMD00019534_069040 [Acytostelium subglobosum LB1]